MAPAIGTPNEWYLIENYISEKEVMDWRAEGLEEPVQNPVEPTEPEEQQYLDELGLAQQFVANGQGW